MNWSAYRYLLFVAAAALAVFGLAWALEPRLNRRQDDPHRTPSEIILLMAVMALGLATIYTNYYTRTMAFGWWDIGSDTMEQYVPYYLNLIESVRSGTLGLWNYQFGLGVSFMGYQSWTLDPFNLVVIPICLVGGSSCLSLALVVAHSLKIILSGLLFDHLLLSYSKVPLARVLGASLYAFCGYIVLWGQHYWLGSVCVTSVALLVALEALMRRWSTPRFVGVMSLSALSIISSIYLGFMIMLFAASYALVRVVHVSQCKSPTQFFRAYGRLAVPAFCGVLLSGIILVPYGSLLLNDSSRVTSTAQASLSSRIMGYLTSFAPPTWIMPVLSRLLGNSLISSGEAIPQTVIPPSSTLTIINVFEFVNLGLSCGAIILLLQFGHWVAQEASARDKVLVSIALLFAVLYCFNAFFPALNTVFADVKYRSSFTVCILACLAMTIGFEHAFVDRTGSLLLLLVGAVMSVGVVVWSFLNTVNGQLDCWIYLAATLLVVMAGYLCLKREATRLLPLLICMAIIGSSVADGFFTTNRRTISSPEDFPLATQPNKASNTQDALAFLKEYDTGFYRIEKVGYYDWGHFEESLSQGYQGITSYNSTVDSHTVDVYTMLLPDIFYLDNVAYHIFTPELVSPQVLKLFGVRYLLSSDEYDVPWLEEVETFGFVHLYRMTDDTQVLTLHTTVVTEGEANALPDAAARLKRIAEDDAVIVPDAVGNSMEAATTSSDLVGTANVVRRGQGLEASTFSERDCIACLSIPAVSGWRVSVDGQEVETFCANYGFIGFKLPAGEHTVRATFVPRGLLPGGLMCLVGLVLAAIACRIGRRQPQQHPARAPKHSDRH